jgi:hypothetical protein
MPLYRANFVDPGGNIYSSHHFESEDDEQQSDQPAAPQAGDHAGAV